MTNVKKAFHEKKETAQNITIYKTLSPIQWFLKLLAASYYYQNKSGEFKKSLLLLIYTIIYLCGNIYFGLAIFQNMTNYYAQRNSFKFAYYLEKAPFFTTPISILCCQLFAGKKIECLKLLDETDKVFLSTDQRARILNANKKIRSLCKKLIITAIVSMVTIGIVPYFVENTETDVVFFIARHSFTTVSYVVQPIEFGVICYCIRTRFRIINQVVKEKIEESERVEKYPINKHFFIRSLKVLLDQHERLRRVTTVINDAFSVQLLCYSLNVLAIFISNGIKIIIVIFDGNSENLILIISWVVAIVFFVEGLTILCHHVNGLVGEANYTTRLLHGIQLRIDDTESIKMMILSTLHLENNKTKLTACKLFNVDFSLLLYICGGALSYLVITYQFVQFKEIQKERMLALSHANNVTITPTESLFYYTTTEIV